MTNLEVLKIAHRIQSRMLGISQALDIKELENPNMAVNPQVADLITKFDNATDAIASRIQRIVSNVNPPLSAEDTAAFQAEIDKLNALGQDPSNPVPSV